MSAAHGRSSHADAADAVGDAPAPRPGGAPAARRRAPRSIRFEPSARTLAAMGLNAMAEDRSAAVVAAAYADAAAHAGERAHRLPPGAARPPPPRRLHRLPPDAVRQPARGGPGDGRRLRARERRLRGAAARRGSSPQAEALGARRPPGVAVDLGCGPGWYTAALGAPVVALDAALAMVRRTREVAPGRLGVQADLLAPARSGAARWRRAGPATPTCTSARSRSRWRSTTCTASLAPGAPIELTLFARRRRGLRGVFPDDDFPGRWFSTWTEERLRDVARTAPASRVDELVADARGGGDPGFTIRAHRAPTLPDFVGAGHAAARVRPQPERARRRRGRRATSPPATASGPPPSRPGSSPATATLATRSVAPRHRDDRPREAGDAAGRRAHPRRVPRRPRAARPPVRVAASRRPSASSAWPAGGRPSTGAPQPGWQDRGRRRASGLRDAVHQRPQRRHAAAGARRPPPRRGWPPAALDRPVKYGAAHGRTTGTAGRVHARARPRAELQREHVLQPLRPDGGRRRLVPLRQPRQRGLRGDDRVPLPARRPGRLHVQAARDRQQRRLRRRRHPAST